METMLQMKTKSGPWEGELAVAPFIGRRGAPDSIQLILRATKSEYSMLFFDNVTCDTKMTK